MNVTIVFEGKVPALKYGGIQRVLWYLGKALVSKGHRVTFLVGEGSNCDFAPVIFLDRERPITEQIPKNADVAHVSYFNRQEADNIEIPHIIHMQANFFDGREYPLNTVFISKDHAQRHGSDIYVYNGMQWEDYGPVDLTNKRDHYHFLGKASWSLKNVKGAIKVAHKVKGAKLDVLGGKRFNINQGIRLTFSPRIRFHGMVGGDHKSKLINGSKGLIFPVIWDEPFGLAITESLYFGCPVFGTPYGSLSELVTSDVGFLSANSNELAKAVRNSENYSRRRCHEYARDLFNSGQMADGFIALYERVLNGEMLHTQAPKLKPEHNVRKLPWA